MEIEPIIPCEMDAPDCYFEESGGTHYTLDAGNPIDFGSVQAGSTGTVSDVYLDNEATGTPSNDLDDPIVDGIAHPTAQDGDPEDTYNAMEYGHSKRRFTRFERKGESPFSHNGSPKRAHEPERMDQIGMILGVMIP